MGAFAAVLLTAAVVAQAAPASPPATSLIAGRVVDGLSNRPVAGAIVSLSGAGLGTTPRAMTNANGYFVFRQLTKGAYNLSASRPGLSKMGAPSARGITGRSGSTMANYATTPA